MLLDWRIDVEGIGSYAIFLCMDDFMVQLFITHLGYNCGWHVSLAASPYCKTRLILYVLDVHGPSKTDTLEVWIKSQKIGRKW